MDIRRTGDFMADASFTGVHHVAINVRDLEKAARSALPILLAGEPGTGKELFARAAHRLSARAEAPFVAVNMGAIPAELFESEMFGHVRGSFTGAVADRKGLFEQANRGTIFLDEVASSERSTRANSCGSSRTRASIASEEPARPPSTCVSSPRAIAISSEAARRGGSARISISA